jgi:hypothetical protein
MRTAPSFSMSSVAVLAVMTSTTANADPSGASAAAADPTSAATVPGVPFEATNAEPAMRTDTPPTDPRTYGEKWVREAGGSLGFMIAPQFHSMTVAPSFGYFIADNVQLSTILSLTNIKAGEAESTIVTATLEPSYHLRLDSKTYAFAGMGFGYSYMRGIGSGLTYTLRFGTQFLFGGNNLFIPSISYDFRTNKEDMPTLAEIAAESALRINLGYATIW